MPWYDHPWFLAAATLLGVLVFYRQLRSMSKKNEFDSLSKVKDLFPERFARVDGGGAAYYELRKRFPEPYPDRKQCKWGTKAYRAGLLDRIKVVAAMNGHERKQAMQLIHPVVNALNDVAELVDFNFIEPQRVLSKYHIAIAREAYIAEPFVCYRAIQRKHGRWGYRILRLGEMARHYNDINPVHRSDIEFDKSTDGDHAVLLYPAPKSMWLPFLKLYWSLRRHVGYPTISERAKRRQNRAMDKLRRDLDYLPKESEQQ